MAMLITIHKDALLFDIDVHHLSAFFVAINRIYSTPKLADNIEAISIDDFALCKYSGCESNPSVAINVDIVKPMPAISETPMT